ncbi:MAG: ATP-binding cassette domain-containing protein [Brachybacterium sp.]|uniref:ATP-binding cassette domain-containing protein n=1 Tax=Brachybacterium sp. TaxID=1891286 RepID=UPI0026478391|nr:ATP-binding cassette domain-containing protein [Brachybacterium sp.]MDN5686003.1 ATP-binding cassette domain-containing protein [Brachybacterium sp.]
MTSTIRTATSTGSAQLRAGDLRLARGGRVLHDGLDLTLAPGDRLAVVGENGRGKTTLLEVFAGSRDADAGTLERHGSLGVVQQDLPLTADPRSAGSRDAPSGSAGSRTVGELLDELLARPLEALREHDEAAAALAEDVGPAASARYDAALEHVTSLDAWDAPRRLDAALSEVEACTDRSRPLATLSVGQRYRVRLAGVLAARDDLLLLDEPTNHLDARGLDHLTRALQDHPGALALVTHDRALLADVATAVLDLDPTSDGRALLVSGGLQRWQEVRHRSRTAWQEAYRAQQEEHARLSSRADEARSRLSTGWRPPKGTGKHQRQTRAPGVVRAMNERLDRLDEHRLDVPPPPPRLTLPDASTSPGTPLLRADDVQIGGRLARTTLRLEGGDRLLVVGPNGAGKTSLLRVLAGELAPDDGAVRVLGRAQIAHLAQEDERPAIHQGSPGERRRRALAALFGRRADLLLLDEPTNHLGISGVEDLLAALEHASSAVVVATHDRWVLRALAHWPRLELDGTPAQ